MQFPFEMNAAYYSLQAERGFRLGSFHPRAEPTLQSGYPPRPSRQRSVTLGN